MGGQPPWETPGQGADPSGAPGESGWGSAPSAGAPPATPGVAAPALRPLDLGDVLDGMFRLLVRHWRTYALALGVVVVPVNLVVVYLQRQANAGLGILDAFRDPVGAQAALAANRNLALAVAALAGPFVVGVFVTPFVSGVTAAIAAQGYLGERPEPGPVLRRTGERYWALLGASLLGPTLLAAVALVPGVLLIAVGIAGGPAPGPIVAGVIAFFLGLVVALVVRFLFVFFPAVVVVERTGPVVALRRSARMVRSRFWALLGTLILALIVGAIVGFVIALPLTVPGGLFSGTVGYVLAAVGTIVATLATTPLFTNAVVLTYFDTRIRTEGFDLDRLARSVEAPRAADAAGGDLSPGGRAG